MSREEDNEKWSAKMKAYIVFKDFDDGPAEISILYIRMKV